MIRTVRGAAAAPFEASRAVTFTLTTTLRWARSADEIAARAALGTTTVIVFGFPAATVARTGGAVLVLDDFPGGLTEATRLAAQRALHVTRTLSLRLRTNL